MKDSMPEHADPNMGGPHMGGPNMGGPNMYGGPHHQMPTPPPPPPLSQHQTSQNMSEHAHNSYQQHHSYQDDGGMANMDLEEPEPEMAPHYSNHRPMPDVYHTAKRQHSGSPQWVSFTNFF